jgi:CHAT domain-containing protein
MAATAGETIDAGLAALLDAAQSALTNYEESEQSDDLDEAIRGAGTLAGSPALKAADICFRADALHLAARCLLARFARDGEAHDLETARGWLGQARDLLGASSPGTASFLDTLASAMAERFQRAGDPEMLREALGAAENAVALTPTGDSRRPGYLNNLASRLSDWFKRWGDARALDPAITALAEALALTPADHPNRPIYLTNLANRHSERFWRFRDSIDLTAGAAAAQEAVDRTEDDHPSRPLRLHNLANVLSDRFDRFQQPGDLDAAIQADDEALDLTPVGHSFELAILHNLATMHLERFRLQGDLPSLEAALECGRGAVAIAPKGHRHQPAVLHTLASALCERFRRRGELADLEAAVDLAERAVALSPTEDPDRLGRLSNLANMRFERFKRWGDLADLDAAVSANGEVLQNEGHPERAAFLNNRSVMLSRRFIGLARVTDLDDAVAAAKEAVRLGAAAPPAPPTYLDTLSNRLLERFRHSAAPSDLEAAVATAREAASVTPAGNSERHAYSNNLGLCLVNRFDSHGQKADLEAAIEALAEAVALAPDDLPALPMYLGNLADALHSRHRRFGTPGDIEAAIEAHSKAIARLHARVATEPQLSRLAGQASDHTRKLVGLLWRAGRYSELAEAIESGRGVRLRAALMRAQRAPIGLNPAEAARFGEIVREQRRLRAEVEGLRAAVAEARPRADPLLAEAEAASGDRALEEEAHTRKLAKETRLKAELVERRALLFRLDDERKELEAHDPSFDPVAPNRRGLRELADASGDVIVYLQPLNGSQGTVWQIVRGGAQSSEPNAADQGLAEEFTADRLKTLLINDPVSRDGKPAEPFGWLMPNLDEIHLGHPADGKGTHASGLAMRRDALEQLLAVLGRELVAPIAERLAEVGARRVVIIPSGQLAFLPFHAATLNDGKTFGDLFEIRYCASATLLGRAYDALPRRASEHPILTALADPARNLPFADGQVRHIAALFGEGRWQVAYGTKATKDWLLRHAASADFLELATHAQFRLDSPVNSGFQLAREVPEVGTNNTTPDIESGDFEHLELGDIWSGSLELKAGCFVGASACETGLTDLRPEALEEQLGFPTAFMSSGASTVMASFWAVSDFSSWLITCRVYEAMLEHGDNASHALQQASQALRTLTAGEVVARLDVERSGVEALRSAAEIARDDETYVAAISTLNELRAERKRIALIDAGDCPFAHPYYWAAFAIHGAVRRTRETTRGTDS